MVPILCIVGKSGLGKTTLLERLVPELARRGVRVAVVKHTDHRVEWDRPGTDTCRLQQAGSRMVAISGPGGLALTRQDGREVTLESIAGLLAGQCDILLVEGYKRSSHPRIEVCRGGGPLSDVEGLLAVVSDDALDVACPVFSTTGVAALADLIQAHFPPAR